MSTKELVLEAIQRLPDSASLEQIRERVEFLAALERAQESLNCGKGIPQDEVEARFESAVKAWSTKSSGRRKLSKTSKH
jgi:hypothetical protein